MLFKWHLNEGDVKGESTLLGGLVFIEFPPTNDTTNLSKGYERFSLGKKIVFQWSKKNQWQKWNSLWSFTTVYKNSFTRCFRAKNSDINCAQNTLNKYNIFSPKTQFCIFDAKIQTFDIFTGAKIEVLYFAIFSEKKWTKNRFLAQYVLL